MDERDESERGGGFREVARLALPLIVGMASYTVMQFCDRVFLSRYSSVTIQAALPAGMLAHALTCFFQSLAAYAGTFSAHYHGARRPEESFRASVQGLWVAVLSWPVVLALIPAGNAAMAAFGHAPAVLAAEKSYFTILMAGGVMVSLNAAAGGYFIGIGRTAVNALANVAGCALNVLLNYVMIFGHWGCPELGIAGAAYATVLSGFAAFAIQFALMVRAARAARPGWRLDGALLGRIVRFGSPAGLQVALDIGASAAFVLMTGRLGDLALAASNIAFSINNLAFAPLLGIGLATSTAVSHCVGAGRPGGARRAGYSGLAMGLAYMAAIGATFVFFPRPYFELFRPAGAVFSAGELYATGRVMLRLMAAWGLLDTVTIVLGQALKGAGDTRFVMLYMAAGGWLVMVPGALALLACGAGVVALWGWLAVYVGLMAAGFAWRWRSCRWQRVRLIG